MRKLTHDEFLAKFNDITKGEYELLSKYVNMRTKIKMKHLTCSNIFDINPGNVIQQNQGCPNCRYKKSSKTIFESKKENVLTDIKSALGTDYEIIGNYEGYNKKIKVKHHICGNEYDQNVADIVTNNKKCPICARAEKAKRRRKSPEQFQKEFNIIANSEYELISEYVTKRTKIVVKHLKCSNEFEIRPGDFLSGTGCPQCNESKGEREIRRILDEHRIKYASQYKFDECRNKNALPFDFAILDDNDNVITLIEYQGIQHYKKTGYFKGESKLKYTQQNDEIKRNFCRVNSINLVEIPYTEFDNIKSVLIKNKII